MLDLELLEMLCCPETHQDLTLATQDEMTALNTAIGNGRVKNRAGAPVILSADEALIRQDRKLAYLVRRDIPIMLIDEAVTLEGII